MKPMKPMKPMKKPQQKPRARSPHLNAQDLAEVRGGENGVIVVNVVVGGGVAADNGVISSHN